MSLSVGNKRSSKPSFAYPPSPSTEGGYSRFLASPAVASPHRRIEISSLPLTSPTQNTSLMRSPLSDGEIRSTKAAIRRLHNLSFDIPKKTELVLALHKEILETARQYLDHPDPPTRQTLREKHAEACLAISSLFLDEALEYLSLHSWRDPDLARLLYMYNDALSSRNFQSLKEQIDQFQNSISEDDPIKVRTVSAICDHILCISKTRKGDQELSSPLCKDTIKIPIGKIREFLHLYEETQKLPLEIQGLYLRAQSAILALYKNRIQEISRRILLQKPPSHDFSPLKTLQDILKQFVTLRSSEDLGEEMQRLFSVYAFMKAESRACHEEELPFSPTDEEFASPSDTEHKSLRFAMPHEKTIFTLCDRLETLFSEKALYRNTLNTGESLLLEHLLHICEKKEQSTVSEEFTDPGDIHIVCRFITKCTPENLDSLSKEEFEAYFQGKEDKKRPSTSVVTKASTRRSSSLSSND